ncbi:mannosyltransferase [Legionella busanensis]|uniref:Mannosyltransferase n=1 Tax=Legionella busanensis TaxID=190655 RepID=A0A378JQB2_9GAMM|nr:glycosyltransferase family 87 protein [Legionella busanensis]STX50312.1 mannosyltransferase [Legionella busanensis]
MTKLQIFPNLSKAFFIFLVMITYILLFYFLFKLDLRLDFVSFYASALAYNNHSNPYTSLSATFLSTNEKLPINLNPPFFMEILRPLAFLNYKEAVVLWSVSIFILGLIGAYFSFKLTLKPALFRKNWLYCLVIYIAFYPTIMSTNLAQIGGLLLFFIVIGYNFYRQNNDVYAGLLWGIITSLKLFPALLFIFAWKEKRYRVLIIMIMTCLTAHLIPVFTYGIQIYNNYFSLLGRVLWYGDSWNASIYGFLFRFLVDPYSRNPDLWLVQLIYYITFISGLIWYIKRLNYLERNRNNHRSFCLTLVVMLVLSPLGWLYYFPLLIMPLVDLYESIEQGPPITLDMSLWIISFLFVNFPIGYLAAHQMPPDIFYKLTCFSVYFYGLLIMAYLLSKPNVRHEVSSLKQNMREKNYLLFPAMLILSFGLFIPLIVFVTHLP